MGKEFRDLKLQLQKFEKMLAAHEDNAESIYFYRNFLRQFLRTKTTSHFVLPTIEIMTILQHEKPGVFKALKRQSKGDFQLEFITELSMNYTDAKQKIEHILNSRSA
ncbi:hypothetical protein [Litchfieldia alkalitelluris]|uniref:hypothetical protein n=1 Tax=Litchfieldia alkalitelluris TaxID=304268 RepID=UPI00099798FA|nr:hypothetical protein [Litchfieldia alkalitelluris]